MIRCAMLYLIIAAPFAAEINNDSPPPISGGTTFMTLSLEQAVKLSAVVTGVKLADLNRAAAEQVIRVERSGLLPQLNAVGTGSRSASPIYPLGYDVRPITTGPYTSLDGRLSAGQTLLDLSSWYRTDAAKSDVRSATAGQRQTLENAALAAATQFVTLAQSHAQVEARRVDLALAEELAALADAQVKAGLAEPINGTRAKTQVSVVHGSLLIAENNVSQAYVNMARILDLDLALHFQVATPFDDKLCVSAAPSSITDAVSLALLQRPEIQASLATIEAEQQRLRAIRGERWGSARIFGDVGRTGPEFDATATNWTVGIQYSVPIFDGLRREGRIEGQDIATRRAALLLSDLRQRVATDARAAVIDLDSGLRYWGVAKERVSLANEELVQARDRFRVGMTSNLDVITAQQSLSAAMDAEIQACSAVAASRARLARAVGIATTLR